MTALTVTDEGWISGQRGRSGIASNEAMILGPLKPARNAFVPWADLATGTVDVTCPHL